MAAEQGAQFEPCLATTYQLADRLSAEGAAPNTLTTHTNSRPGQQGAGGRPRGRPTVHGSGLAGALASPEGWVPGSLARAPGGSPGSVALQEPGALAGIPGWPPLFPLSPHIWGRHFLLPGPAGQVSTQMESPTQGPPKESSPWKRHKAPARHRARGRRQASRGPGPRRRQPGGGRGRGPQQHLAAPARADAQTHARAEEPSVPGAPVRVLPSFLSLSFLDSAPPGSECCSDRTRRYSNPGWGG